MSGITRRHAVLVAAGLGGGLGAARQGHSGASAVQTIDFERARISWTTKTGIHGSWRVIATACRQDDEDCLCLAPVVMAGEIFGAGRLPRDPPYSYQLIATRQRHGIVREGEGNSDNDADNAAVFSSFDIDAPRRAATSIDIATLDAEAVARLWPLAVRLRLRGSSGKFWDLEFPLGHINTRAADFQIESGPILIPQETTDIAGASIAGGCYLAYVFLNRTNQVDLLAWGPAGSPRRSFSRFARIEGIEAELFGRTSDR